MDGRRNAIPPGGPPALPAVPGGSCTFPEHAEQCRAVARLQVSVDGEHAVDIRSRGKDGWRTTVVHEGAIAELSIGARLNVRELYDAAAEPSA